MKKQKLLNKRGISLVVAMALSVFLLIITGGFLSLSITQQSDTGAELNTRQAYVSAKSTLDLAKDWVENGKLNADFPAAGHTKYYVFYQENAGAEIKCKSFNSSAAVLQFMKDNPGYIFYGDSYVKVTVDNAGKGTMSSFSSVGEFNAGKENFGDLSLEFGVQESTLPVSVNGVVKDTELLLYGSPSKSNQFLMVGQQTNFSLLKSAPNNQGSTYRTLADSFIEENGQRIWRPNLNSEDEQTHSNYTVDSHFPLVYTDPIKLDTNAQRAVFKAYNQGIYLLGSYNLSNNSDYDNNDVNVAMFTNDKVFGAQFHCTLLVLGNNIAARRNDAVYVTAYAKDAIEYNGEKGVVLYVPKTTYVYVNSSEVDKFETGYYFLKTTNYEETSKIYYASLFNIPSRVALDTSEDGMSKLPVTIQNIINNNMYSSLVTENAYSTTVNNIQGASDKNKFDNDIEKIQFTDDTGKFSDDKKIYNSSAGAIRKDLSSESSSSQFYSKWNTASIYCGPNEMPASSTRYDLYCGKSFNFLWYSLNNMVVKSKSEIYLSSSNNVLTIGPDFGERVEKVTVDWGSYYANNHNGNGSKSSNIMEAEDSNSAFYVCPSPYETVDEKTKIKLTVMNDFIVKYSDKQYTIHKGEYTIPQKDGDKTVWTFSATNHTGLNLFSDAAKDFFGKYQSLIDPDDPSYIENTSALYKEISAWESPCNWVTDGTYKKVNTSASPKDLSISGTNNINYFVNFEVLSGALPNVSYKATSIDAKFPTQMKTHSVQFTARKFTIDTPKICGSTLYVDTYSMNNALYEKNKTLDNFKKYVPNFIENGKDASVLANYKKGQLIEFKQNTEIYDSTGTTKKDTIAAGKYFILTTSPINILNPESWYGTNNYYLVQYDGETAYKMVSNEKVYDFTFEEGKYF